MVDIISIDRTDRCHQLTDGRVLSKVACIGGNEPLSESYRFRNARQQTTRRGRLSMQVEQMAQRLDWRPTWLAIIADIQNSTRLQPVPDSVDDRLPRLLRNPRPYAMQCDDIELR